MSRAGTAYYTAPEVTLGDGYDVKADVFSFGIMMAEVVLIAWARTGPICSDIGTRKLMVADAVVFLKAQGQELLGELLTACSQNDPKHRLSSREALTFLESIPGLGVSGAAIFRSFSVQCSRIETVVLCSG